jgi:hypothetical protein
MVRNAPKHKFWVQWSGSGAFVVKNFDTTSCTNGASSSTFLHRLSCTNEKVRNALKHDFWGPKEWMRSVHCENSDASLFSELVR